MTHRSEMYGDLYVRRHAHIADAVDRVVYGVLGVTLAVFVAYAGYCSLFVIFNN